MTLKDVIALFGNATDIILCKGSVFNQTKLEINWERFPNGIAKQYEKYFSWELDMMEYVLGQLYIHIEE